MTSIQESRARRLYRSARQIAADISYVNRWMVDPRVEGPFVNGPRVQRPRALPRRLSEIELVSYDDPRLRIS